MTMITTNRTNIHHWWTNVVICIILAATFAVTVVEAAFSIAATDSVTKEIGAAGASCVDGSIYDALYLGVPGHGVLLLQGKGYTFAEESPIYATADDLLLSDTPPEDILDAITDPFLDSGFEEIENTMFWYNALRQYGCVDLEGRAAGYTGDSIEDIYNVTGMTDAFFGVDHSQEHFSGRFNDLTYSAQGNLVTENTVPTLSDTFTTAEDSCDLADRLYQAIAAPFEVTAQAVDITGMVGDVRCYSENQAAAGGIFLHVDASDGTEIVHIDILGDTTIDPFPMFKEAYETWRAANPCGGLTEAPTLPPDDNASTEGPIGGSGNRDIFDESEATALVVSSLTGWSMLLVGGQLLFLQ